MVDRDEVLLAGLPPPLAGDEPLRLGRPAIPYATVGGAA